MPATDLLTTPIESVLLCIFIIFNWFLKWDIFNQSKFHLICELIDVFKKENYA